MIISFFERDGGVMLEMYVGSLYNKNISQIPQNYLLQVVKE